jgi:endonuclease III
MAGRTTDARVPPRRQVEKLVRSIEERLRERYQSPRLGNPEDPLDDLVFILLSGRTRGVVHEGIYGELKYRFPDWSSALVAGVEGVARVIERAGLGRKKAEQIVRLLGELQSRFGRPTLAPLTDMSDAEAEALLTSLPGVGVKTARCVLMYTLDRRLFPVDAHALRILGYFGLVSPDVRQEYAQDPLQDVVPEELRYSLHVNLVAHGRETCLPARPRCADCCLRLVCPQSNAPLP